ncbi:MAG: hypothetical protein IKA64_04580 [Clostridia bacterium]|nr:hypothetical protein [Clostridia bacterium]
MEINERATYIKGLFDGYELDKTSKEGKVIAELIDLTVELAGRVLELESENSELRGYMSEIAEDLVALEEDIYDDGEEYADYSDLDDEDDDDYVFDEDEEYYEIECPHCAEKICFTDEVELESLVCPACAKPISDSLDEE